MLSSNNILSARLPGSPLATPTAGHGARDATCLTYSGSRPADDGQQLRSSKPSPTQATSISATTRSRSRSTMRSSVRPAGARSSSSASRNSASCTWTTAGRVLFNAATCYLSALDELLPPGEELEFDFLNATTLAKAALDRYVLALSDRYGAHTLAPVLEHDQDARLPVRRRACRRFRSRRTTSSSRRRRSRSSPSMRSASSEVHLGQYDRGLITEDERHETIVNIWTRRRPTSSRTAMQDHFDELNPVFMMANSGARGSFQADPAARRYARAHGKPEGRDHRAPDQGQLHGRRFDGARVLHLDPRRAQGHRRTRRLRTADSKVPHPAARRRPRRT